MKHLEKIESYLKSELSLKDDSSIHPLNIVRLIKKGNKWAYLYVGLNLGICLVWGQITYDKIPIVLKDLGQCLGYAVSYTLPWMSTGLFFDSAGVLRYKEK